LGGGSLKSRINQGGLKIRNKGKDNEKDSLQGTEKSERTKKRGEKKNIKKTETKIS